MLKIEILRELDDLVPSILFALLIFLMGLEFFLGSNDVKGDTIKVRIREWAYGKSFYITFLWGVLTGHFYFGAENPLIRKTEWSIVAIIIASILLILIGKFVKIKITMKHQFILLIIGVLFGHFLFSMNSN